MDGCNGCFKDNCGGWMVKEMDGCNGRFKDYSGWMVKNVYGNLF